jgi:MFS superfamily sulfate permease-like transporter
MGISVTYRDETVVDISVNEVTGAVGDSVTVLPIVVAVAVLTDRSLQTALVWFGVFQIVWGLYYGVPISVEPMKALAALVIADSISTAAYLLSGLVLGVVLLGVGVTNSLRRLGQYVETPVVRGVQLGVALVLVETGVRLALGDPGLAAAAVVVAAVPIWLGYWNLTALAVVGLGGVVAVAATGDPLSTATLVESVRFDSASFDATAFDSASFGSTALALATVEATAAQLAMTVGNAAMATAVLLDDYFDRTVSADDLAESMGVTNLLAVPLGGMPMCHGSGGVAGKYAFGARTAGANVVLGVGYVLLAGFAVEVVANFPLAVLGVVLALVALQLGRTGLERTNRYPPTVAVAAVGLLVNLGVAFVVGLVLTRLWREWSTT